MTKVLLTGCNGRMGKVITELAAADPEIGIVAGIDVAGTCAGDYPVYGSIGEVQETPDVIVDFSSPKVFDGMMDYAVDHQVPVVVCTTGLSEEQIRRIGEDARKVAVLRSANMSLGINLLLKLVKEAAGKLAPEGFDIEIVERHHNQKKDAPSGTALALAESINEGMDNAYSFTFDRSRRLEKRRPKEIGISAVRGGNIPGTHEVIFAGPDEVIEFNHIAYSRSIFGKGALAAAKFLAGKGPGLYTMADVIG
jgi:4-hydroxy-tetrahydrodipicolinate reductase